MQRVVGATLTVIIADVDENGDVGAAGTATPMQITGQQFAAWDWPEEVVIAAMALLQPVADGAFR